MKQLSLSLADLLGEDYLKAVCAARSALTGEDPQALWGIAETKVPFLPERFMDAQERLMRRIGSAVASGLTPGIPGAATKSFTKAQNSAASPLSSLGCFRVGEDGRLYFAAKSEHYQIPLGHGFPGFQLIDYAKRLGIPNATHNSARGYITRFCEQQLVLAAAGRGPDSAPDDLIASESPQVLNRVLNLETGSLAVEAALKMMMAQFYPISGAAARYPGRIPVFLVMADYAGGITAGYHGTTFIAQTLRGLWPDFRGKAEEHGLYRVVSVPINDAEGFARIIGQYNRAPFKTAGFCHEIIMMNYGAEVLEKEYLQQAYALCHRYDTPVLCDEIQSCGWYDGVFLFKQYRLSPDFLVMGKGLPGGNYPASKVICTAPYDNLIQFGALVTNGQEELASLSYLISMAFLRENGATITAWGQHFHQSLKALALAHPALCEGTNGHAHMSALRFLDVQSANRFCERMQRDYAVDVSAQAYKPNCPPTALFKLPLITTPAMMDILCQAMDACLSGMEQEESA